MGKTTAGTPDYTMGFSDEVLESVRRHTAEASAAYLLPHLRPGMNVLDFGCGPGTVSIGLARAVAPGEMHGVDMEESQIDLARTVAAALGRENARFHVGDITGLPFADGFFDVAHCHDVLMHVPDTDAALAEIKRVLKPGGIIACREMICESCFTHPDFGIIDKAWEMFEDIVATNDGHPQMGKDLKNQLVRAGFANVRVSASFDIYSTPQDVDFIYRVASRWFLSPDFTDTAVAYGAATDELAAGIGAAYNEWKTHPGALCALAFGEALAVNPGPDSDALYDNLPAF